jgi:multidrug transporter EmrE-like cation transporter
MARAANAFEMPWLYLIVGGLFEVGFTTSLRFVDGFRNVPWTIAFLVSVVLGVLISGLVHTGKMAARPAINVGTVGTGAPVVSTLEDISSLSLSLIALIAPVLVILALALLAWLLIWMWLRVRRWRRTRRDPAYTAT